MRVQRIAKIFKIQKFICFWVNQNLLGFFNDIKYKENTLNKIRYFCSSTIQLIDNILKKYNDQ